jgi:hypothetical protein
MTFKKTATRVRTLLLCVAAALSANAAEEQKPEVLVFAAA